MSDLGLKRRKEPKLVQSLSSQARIDEKKIVIYEM